MSPVEVMNVVIKFSQAIFKFKYIGSCSKLATKMTMEQTTLLAPPVISNMKALERESFTKEITVPCLQLLDITQLEELRPIVKSYILKLPNFKPIKKVENNGLNIAFLILNPQKIQHWTDFDEDVLNKLSQLGIDARHFQNEGVQLNYKNWNANEILRAVLPEGLEMSSFSQIGHIIHLNLRDNLLPYKKIIGEILLDKTPNARTVVNKLNKIDNTYRNFEMELICGENEMVTVVKENRSTFKFDFSKVYWNSRLCTEHSRIVDVLLPGDVLIDVFCGVGPFAIPCAKKKVRVYANDLNPDSILWLKENVKLNNVKDGYITAFNKDGKDFITYDAKSIILSLARNSTFEGKIHVTMNLPAISLDFVQYFHYLFDSSDISVIDIERVLPVIHIYFFVVGDDPVEGAKSEFSRKTTLNFDSENMTYQYVRNVSPNKNMVKISFKLVADYAWISKNEKHCDMGEPPRKRPCLS